MHRSRAAVFAVGSAVVLALSGCGSSSAEDPETTTEASPSVTPSPTPTKTLDPEEAAKQQDLDEANAMLVEYFEVSNTVAQGGYTDSELLSGMLAGDARLEVLKSYQQLADLGMRETGDTVLEATELLDHEPGPDGRAGTTVVLAVCLDLSQTDIVDANGESILDPDEPKRVVTSYSTVRQDDGRWTVTKVEPLPDETC